MKILFLTLLDFNSLSQKGIYTDLLRNFTKDSHEVYVISPIEKRNTGETKLVREELCSILKLKIGNIQKTNLIEKGITTLTLEGSFKRAIDKYFGDVKFDLILYSTPPITLQKTVEYVKKRDGAITYLLLKDIFPQNAVDLGILSKKGWKGLLYKYFRRTEDKLYKSSDYIGCMSEGNVRYLLENNHLDLNKVEVCPNSIEISAIEETYNRENILDKYNIPKDKIIYLYGGNLGKPQGIDFVMECLKSNRENIEMFFLIVGNGTEFGRLKKTLDEQSISNVKLMDNLPKLEYDELAKACDVGLIFLDKRFTIPNFPSRLLSYMEMGIPVVAATDTNTDIGDVIENGKFGFWSESGDVQGFNDNIRKLKDIELRQAMGSNSRKYLEDNYSSRISYDIIMKHFNK